MWLVDLNYNFECDWLIALSDNKLSNNKLSDNNLSSELVEKRNGIEEIVIFMISIIILLLMLSASVIFLFLYLCVFCMRGEGDTVDSEKPSGHVSIKYVCVFMESKEFVWKSH